MRPSKWICISLIALLSVFWSGCGGGGGAASTRKTTVSASSPVITSLQPSAVDTGGPAFVLQVTGTNFLNGATVHWNGSARTTTSAAATILTAQIKAADIASAGSAQITVVNPDGGTSPAVTLPIQTLQITSLDPAQVKALSGPFNLLVHGPNLDNSTGVMWNGVGRPTYFVDANTLMAIISETDIVSSGTAQVSVQRRVTGVSSNPLTFTILPPDPLKITTSSLPATSASKGFDFTLQATRPADSVNWSVAGGALPPGMTLDYNGRLHGTAPMVATDTSYNFDALVQSSFTVGEQDQRSFSILVRAAGTGRNDDCATATPISNGTIRASISPYGDLDVYSFQGTAGQLVRIETTAQRLTSPVSHLDSVVQLLDSNCTQLTFNDDIDTGVVTDSLIDGYTLPYTGTYYVRVMDFRGDGRPDFLYDLILSGAN